MDLISGKISDYSCLKDRVELLNDVTGFKMRYGEENLYFRASLQESIEENYSNASYGDIKKWIEEMINLYGKNFQYATIGMLEVAIDYPTPDPSKYISNAVMVCGDYKGSGYKFGTHNEFQQINFYEKKHRGRKSDEMVLYKKSPDLLRLEYRIKGTVGNKVGLGKQLIIKDLLDYDKYRRIISFVQSKINRLRFSPDLPTPLKKGQAEKQALLIAYEQGLIDMSLMHRNDRCKLKKKIKELQEEYCEQPITLDSKLLNSLFDKKLDINGRYPSWIGYPEYYKYPFVRRYEWMKDESPPLDEKVDINSLMNSSVS